MNEKVTVEMTPAEYQDYLLLQVARAAETARRGKQQLEAAEARWAEALQRAKASGCTDEQLSAVSGLEEESIQTITARVGSRPAQESTVEEVSPVIHPSPQPEGSVGMLDNYFQPREITIADGDELVLINRGTSLHNFSIEEGDVDVDVQPGESVSVDLSSLAPGTYAFFCTYQRQQGMEGTITIADAQR